MGTIEREVAEYLEWCEKVRGFSEATMAQKRNVLSRFMVVTKVAGMTEIDNGVFNRWVAHENERGISVRSLNMYNAVVAAMVRYFRETGVNVPVNLGLVPRMRDDGAKQRRFYTAEEVALVVSRADEVSGLMIRVMFETGMRIAELVRLRWSDFDGRWVRFMGKGRKMREVYVTEETFRLLFKYTLKYGIGDGYLWCVCDGMTTLNGEPPTVNTVREHLRLAFEAAGFAGFYPHALRHSFATDLQLRGASVAEIKEMIGHSSIATTERYLHGFDGKMKELFDKYR